jgi:hypothetical protein
MGGQAAERRPGDEMKLTKGHKQVKCYADGGAVGSEYGTPTYARAVLARVGIGDGYGNPKKGKKEKAPPAAANAVEGFKASMTKRKKALDDI